MTNLRRISVGEVAIFPIVDIPRLLVNTAEFFPGQDLATGKWFTSAPFVDAGSGDLVLTIQAFLVTVRDRVVLLDCAVGNGKSRRRPQFDRRDSPWLDRLRKAGFAPADVDTVIISHLHVDHVGWATTRHAEGWMPTFPAARYFFTERDLAYWRGVEGRAAMGRTGDYLADSIEPLIEAGVASTADPTPYLPPEIRVEDGSGHTPGNVVVRVRSEGQEAVLCGDVMHSAVQCAHPDLNSRYCCDQAEAAGLRYRLLDEAARSGSLLVPAHFPPPTAGRVHRYGAGFRFEYVTG